MGDAFTGRAVLHRERENLKKEVIQVDIKGIMDGTAPDVPLQRNDVLYIPSIHDLEDVGSVMVYGEVARPGEFAFADNTTLEDIIIQAGGLMESASSLLALLPSVWMFPAVSRIAKVRKRVPP